MSVRVRLTADEKTTVRQAIDRAKRARLKGPIEKVKTPSRPLVKEIVAERPVRAYGHCPLCGFPCLGRACPEHWDVIQNDPYFQMKGRAA